MTLQRATIHVSEAGLRRDRTIAPGLAMSAWRLRATKDHCLTLRSLTIELRRTLRTAPLTRSVMRHQTPGPFVAQWPLSATAVVDNMPLSPSPAWNI